MKLYSMSEVLENTGIKRTTLQRFEEDGAVTVIKKTYGRLDYWYFDEENYKKIWKIKFYSDLGYKRSEIERLLENGEEALAEEISSKKRELIKEKERIEKAISAADAFEECRLTPVSLAENIGTFENVDYRTMTDIISCSMLGSIFSEEDIEKGADIIVEYIDRLLDLYNEGFLPSSDEAAALVGEVYELFERKCLKSSGMFYSLARSNIAERESREMLEEEKSGFSDYLLEALESWKSSQSTSCFEDMLEEFFETMERLCDAGAKAQSEEVQKEIEAFSRMYKGVCGEMIDAEAEYEHFKDCFSEVYKGMLEGGNREDIDFFDYLNSAFFPDDR